MSAVTYIAETALAVAIGTTATGLLVVVIAGRAKKALTRGLAQKGRT